MSVPTDTPSTNGAPDPEEVIARVLMCELECCLGEDPEPTDVHDARRVLAALAAAGFRVVPEDRPAQCGPLNVERTYHKRVPDHWTVDILDEHGTVCEVPAASSTDEDAHDIAQRIAAALAAGVPALDDDKRREVEALVEDLAVIRRHLIDRDSLPQAGSVVACAIDHLRKITNTTGEHHE